MDGGKIGIPNQRRVGEPDGRQCLCGSVSAKIFGDLYSDEVSCKMMIHIRPEE